MEGLVNYTSEVKISNHTFLPSIEHFSSKIDSIKDRPFAEVFDFDKIDSEGQPHFKMDILKKYVKFHVMIRYRNKGI